MNHGCAIWLTGVSGAGKTTLAKALGERLAAMGRAVTILDGDALRTAEHIDLGHTPEDRQEQTRRVGVMAARLAREGFVVIVALISPYRQARDEVRALIPQFLEVHLSCPLATLVARDGKGLYAPALAGELSDFPGVSSPYEAPLAPEGFIDSSMESVEQGVEKVLRALTQAGAGPGTLKSTGPA